MMTNHKEAEETADIWKSTPKKHKAVPKKHPILTAKTASSRETQIKDISTGLDKVKTSQVNSSVESSSGLSIPAIESTVHNDQFLQLKEYLPQTSAYIIEKFQHLELETFLAAPPCAFQVHFWLQVDTAASAQTWIQQLEEKTKTTYRITKGTAYGTTGKRIIFKTVQHCQHKRKTPTKKMPIKKFGHVREGCEKSTRDKKTGCPSTLSVTIMSPDKHMKHPLYPCLVKLLFNHNHPIDSGHALIFRPISETARKAYVHLFEDGNSASSARHEYVTSLQLEYDGNQTMQRVLANRSINPSTQDVQRLFQSWRLMTVGAENGTPMFVRLNAETNRYNKFTEADGGKVHMQQYTAHTDSKLDIPSHSQDHPYCKPKEVKQQTESPFVLVIVTPLMARVHKLVQQAGEMVFCDATASLDRLNAPVFIISTATAAGALPLAVLMTSGEDVSTMTEAFRILKTILPPDAFFRRGPQLGPMGIMTDDSASERQSLRATWPQATLFLCSFHFLQSTWQWLWNSTSEVDRNDRLLFMSMVKDLLFAKTSEQLYAAKNRIDCNEKVQQHKLFRKRLQQYWERRDEWCVCLRKDFMTRGNNTNNYSEQVIRITKDIILIG